VSERAGGSAGDDAAPLSWRVPAYQTALLFLVVCLCAAVNLYAHPSDAVATGTIFMGVVSLALAVSGLRMFLYVDDDGVAVRHLLRESWLPWAEIKEVDLVSGVRGADTIRFIRRDGSRPVNVPPSLLQPSKPLTRPHALARLKGIQIEIEARRGSLR
jgi:hypothetical protein